MLRLDLVKSKIEVIPRFSRNNREILKSVRSDEFTELCIHIHKMRELLKKFIGKFVINLTPILFLKLFLKPPVV